MGTASIFDETFNSRRKTGARATATITLSDVFARLAQALDADVGASTIERHVRGYAPPKSRSVRAAATPCGCARVSSSG